MTCSVVLRFPQLQCPVVTTPNIQYSFKNWYLAPSLFVMLTYVLACPCGQGFQMGFFVSGHLLHPTSATHSCSHILDLQSLVILFSTTTIQTHCCPSTVSHPGSLLVSSPVRTAHQPTSLFLPFEDHSHHHIFIQPRLRSPTLESLACQNFCFLASLSFQWSHMTMA